MYFAIYQAIAKDERRPGLYRALTAYMPLISKYDLHLLEICKSAQELSVGTRKNVVEELHVQVW